MDSDFNTNTNASGANGNGVRQDHVEALANALIVKVRGAKDQEMTELEVAAAVGLLVAKLCESESSVDAFSLFVKRHLAAVR